jgi:aerobic carbon-monoxide dehydrogenase small subunit
VRSCLMLAVQADGRHIDTIEGLASKDGTLSVLQTAFHRHFAVQCGYCTPGFLMTLAEYLERNPAPTEADIRVALSGNMCRCSGYAEIVDAAVEAAKQLQAQTR